jgi:hypothetical protein
MHNYIQNEKEDLSTRLSYEKKETHRTFMNYFKIGQVYVFFDMFL